MQKIISLPILLSALFQPILTKPPLLYWGKNECWNNSAVHLLWNMDKFVNCLLDPKNRKTTLELVDKDLPEGVAPFGPALMAFIDLCEIIKQKTEMDEGYNEYAMTEKPFMKYHKQACLAKLGGAHNTPSTIGCFFSKLLKPGGGPCNFLIAHRRSPTITQMFINLYLVKVPGVTSGPFTTIADTTILRSVRETLSTYLFFRTLPETAKLPLVEPFIDLTKVAMPKNGPPSSSSENYFYELIGIGMSERGGIHSVCCVKDQWEKSPCWWFCDDHAETVEPLTYDDFPTSLPGEGRWKEWYALVLVYQRIDKIPSPEEQKTSGFHKVQQIEAKLKAAEPGNSVALEKLVASLNALAEGLKKAAPMLS